MLLYLNVSERIYISSEPPPVCAPKTFPPKRFHNRHTQTCAAATAITIQPITEYNHSRVPPLVTNERPASLLVPGALSEVGEDREKERERERERERGMGGRETVFNVENIFIVLCIYSVVLKVL